MSLSQYVSLISLLGVMTFLDFIWNEHDCSMQDPPLYTRHDVRESANKSILVVFSDRDGDHQDVSGQRAANYPRVSSNTSVEQVVEAKLASEASHHLKIARQPGVDDNAEVFTDRDVICPSCCASEKLGSSSPEAWTLMAKVASILNRLSAPYTLHSGALLGLVRDCDLLGDEVSFALERNWFLYNFHKVRMKLSGAGSNMVHKYGSLAERGYEETWSMGEVRIHIMSYDVAPNGFTWVQWTPPRETPNPCFTLALNFELYSWKGVDVRIPVPVHLALEVTYGSNYMKKHSWIEDKHPFDYSCKHNDASDYAHWGSSLPRLQSSVTTEHNEVERVFEAEFDLKSSHHLEIARQQNVNNSLAVVLDLEHICPGCCNSDKLSSSKPNEWSVMAAVASIMHGLNAPYVLYGSALLGLVRGCDLLEDDMDFAIERQWFTNNFNHVKTALVGLGFEIMRDYRGMDERGYEVQFRKDSVKVDFISYDLASNGFSWALWTGEGRIRNECFTPALSFERYTWKGVDVRIPVPVQLALEATYGSNYMKTEHGIWNKLRLEHSCKQQDTFEDFDRQSSKPVLLSSTPRLQLNLPTGQNVVEQVLQAQPDREASHRVEIVRQDKVDDHVEAILDPENICPGCCLSGRIGTSSPVAWSVLSTVASIMHGLNAPYVLHGSALLGLVRGCDLLEDDMDFAIERQWFTNNFNRVKTALVRLGFEIILRGMDERGYEVQLRKDSVKVDLISYDFASNGFSWALWSGEGRIRNECFTPALSFEWYNWKGVYVRIPVPVQLALEATYGSNYMKSEHGIWNKLRLEHSCKQKDTFEDFDRQSSKPVLLSSMPRLQLNAPTGHNVVEPVLQAQPDREASHRVEIVRQDKVDDHIEAILDPDNICPGCCPSGRIGTSSPVAWSVLSTVASIMSRLSAPYVLHGGALLGLVRNCDLLQKDDMDFAIERQWFTHNFFDVKTALVGAGFKMIRDYGRMHERGYEMEFSKDSVKVDFISYDSASNGFSWALWTGRGTTRNDCFTPALSFERYRWKEVDVRIPVPLKAVLEATYGSDYMKKQTWIWNKHPFEHSCKQANPFEYFDWKWRPSTSRRPSYATTFKNGYK